MFSLNTQPPANGASGTGDVHLDGNRPISSCHVDLGEALRAVVNRQLTSIW